MLKSKNKRIVIAGLMLALGILLPFVTGHGYGLKGTVLLPMHIPVLLCGFFCGPFWGGLCGLILPYINSILTGMPVMFPSAVIMSGELLAYGFVSGFLYQRTGYSNKLKHLYPVLVTSLIAGRVVYGIIANVLLLFNQNLGKLSVVAAVVTGIPGIIIQLILVPIIVLYLGRHLNLRYSAKKRAIELVKNAEKTCVVVKNNEIISAHSPKGIAHITKLHEQGILKDSFVADTIIGKAAAMIFTLSGVKECFGLTMSEAGYNWLKEHDIDASYGTLTDVIQNRKGDGMCPMETVVKDLTDENEALEKLKDKVQELSKKQKEIN